MIYFDNDLWSVFTQKGGIYVRGNGSVLEDMEFKDGKLTDMECDVNYLAPAHFKQVEDEIHFFVEQHISQYYCNQIEVCKGGSKNIDLNGRFTYEEDGSPKLQEMVYAEHGYDDQGQVDRANGFRMGLENAKGRVVLPEVIFFSAEEENNDMLDIVFFVPKELVPENIKQAYEATLQK